MAMLFEAQNNDSPKKVEQSGFEMSADWALTDALNVLERSCAVFGCSSVKKLVAVRSPLTAVIQLK